MSDNRRIVIFDTTLRDGEQAPGFSMSAGQKLQMAKALEYAQRMPGPHLIEAVIPESLSGVKRRILPWMLRSLPSLPLSVSKALKRKLAP